MRVFSWDEMTADGGAALQAFLSSQAEKAAGGKRREAFSALTIGDFDGWHLGHAALFRNVAEASRRSAAEAFREGATILVPGAVTFRREAAFIEKKGKASPCISTLRQRLAAMEMAGIAFALLIDFSYNFSKMSGSGFIKALAELARMRYLSVGEDFRCGFQLDTGQAEIAQAAGVLGFEFEPLEQVRLGGKRVSSTEIRKAVLLADFAAAEKLMRHPFALDISGVSLDHSAEGGEGRAASAFYAPLGAFSQILPPAGKYHAFLQGGGAEALECRCSIGGQAVLIECEKKLFFRDGKIAADKEFQHFFDEIRLIKELSF